MLRAILYIYIYILERSSKKTATIAFFWTLLEKRTIPQDQLMDGTLCDVHDIKKIDEIWRWLEEDSGQLPDKLDM